MRSRKYGDVYAVRIDRGEELMEKLKELCGAENIRFAQVSAIGASEHAVLGIYDLAKQEYARESVSGFCEITSLAGSITTVNEAPYIHLHATLADQQHQIHGGHVLELTVGATCEMFIQVIGPAVGRVHDDALGINLWDL
jgi:predicted DNA-binding protein with PD1-like motif